MKENNMTTATLTVRITENCECEMSPALSDADIYSDDPFLRSLAPVAEAFNNGRRVKGGTVVTITGRSAIKALRTEAKYRSGECADQAQDAMDNSERMMYINMKRSFDSIVKKCDAAIAASDPEPEIEEVKPTPKPVMADGPTVIVTRRPGVVVYTAAIVRFGQVTPVWHLDWGNRKAAFDTMAEAQADAESYWAQVTA